MIRSAAAGLVVAACFATGAARADPSIEDRSARALRLFEDGKALRGAGRDVGACADFEESRRIEEGIGVTLYLADCYQHIGYAGRALAEFRRAEALAAERSDPRKEVARRRADALDPLGPALGQPGAQSAGQPPASGRDARSADGDAAPPRPHADARRATGIALAGVGIVGLGLGTAFGALAMAKQSQSNAGPCGADDRCTADGLALRRQSTDAALVSTVAFGAGALSLAGGIALYLSAPHGGERVALSPVFTAGGAGVALAGRF